MSAMSGRIGTSLAISDAILIEAALSYLGLGVTPPTPSLGALLSERQGDLFLLVSDFNLPAQQFHAAHGYLQAGALANYGFPGTGELIYRKLLRENAMNVRRRSPSTAQ
jgi:hypothetical protein